MIPVSPEQLETLAAMAPDAAQPERRGNRGGGQPFDLDRWIAGHGLTVVVEKPWRGGCLRWTPKVSQVAKRESRS